MRISVLLGRVLLVAVQTGCALELPLRQDRLAACKGISESDVYASSSTKIVSLMGGFRTNPLPEAFLPSVDTVSTQRVSSFRDYAWTLSPYFLGAGTLLAAMVLACPCCCGFICYASSKQRVPFLPLAGICFNITFALLSLLVLLALLVAVEEHGKAWRAYSNAKCAAFVVVDTLVNGNPISGLRKSGFLGFRELMAAITAASTTFPDALLSIQAVASTLDDGSEDDYASQGQEYYAMWGHLHRRDMQVTPFHCMLCEDASLQPLLASIEEYSKASRNLHGLFDQVKRSISDTEPMLTKAMKRTLSNVDGLYRLSFSYSERLRTFTQRSDRLWSKLDIALCTLSACSIVCVALGVASLFACRGGACAFAAWWFAYATAAGLLFLAGVLFSATTAAHDSAGLLQHVFTEAGVDLYSPSLLQDLNAQQRLAVDTCLIPRGNGKLSAVFNISGGRKQVQDAADLREAKKALDASSLNETRLRPFLKKYKTYGGDSYIATWNASQSLGWLGERSGLLNMLDKLYKLTGEHWAFKDAQAPSGCAMALEFDPSVQVAQFNCFWVTSSHPTESELKERYVSRLDVDQMDLLLSTFAKARKTSSALRTARSFAATNAQAVLKLQDKWRDSSHRLNKAMNKSLGTVARPMIQAMNSISGIILAMDCSSVRHACVGGMQALGNDFVASFLALSSCVAVLASCSVGLTLLYCMLWSIQQQGPTYAFKKLSRHHSDSDPGDDYSLGSGSDDGDGGYRDDYDEALELQQLLNKGQRGARRS